MHILGKYTINIATKQVRLTGQVMPLFCRQDLSAPGLDAYFLNTIAYEQATVKKQFFTALTNLSNFKIEHLIKLKNKMIKIQNTGKVILDKTSKAKKLMGTIVSIDYLQAASVNCNEHTNPEIKNKAERQVFNVEDLLNRFVYKQKALANANKIQLYVKTDIELPKSPIEEIIEIETRLQQLFDKIVKTGPAGEITLIAKLVQSYEHNLKVNFSIVAKHQNQKKSKDFEILLKKTADPKNANAVTKGVAFDVQQPMNILLVEDYEMNQVVATNILKREFENVRIDLAENGLIAFEKVQQNQYDLILMDISMPVLNGIEATRKIRTELQCTTPVLAFSAHVFPQEIQNCFNVGMNDFIAKPINVATLKQKIIQALCASDKPLNTATYRSMHTNFDCNKKVAI